MRLSVCLVMTAMLAAAQTTKIPITTASEKARASFLQAREMLENLRSAEARPLLDEAIREDPNFAMALLLRAYASPSGKEHFDSINAAVAAAPKVSEGEQLLIRAAHADSNGNQDEAGRLYAKLAAAFPDDERARWYLGSFHSLRRDHRAAIAELRTSVQLSPGYAPAYNGLGYAFMETGDDRDAEAAFRKYVQLIPNEPNPHDSLAELLMKLGRFDESIAEYRKALALDPHFASAHRGIAASLLYQNRHGEALEQLGKGLAAARDDAERRAVYRAMAVCHIDRARRTEALALLSKSAQLAEKSGDHVAMFDAVARGDVLLDAGKTAAARREYVRALALARQSNLPDLFKKIRELMHRGELALVAAVEKDFATATREAEAMRAGFEGLANSSEKFRIQEVLGIVALRQKKWDEAVSHLKQAHPKSPWVMFHIAKAYEGKQDRESALTWYRKAATTYVLPAISTALVRQAALRAAADATKGPS